MMKKKISILTLSLLFLVSTTGMPIWSHYCEMIGKKSFTECEACVVEIETSCCSDELLNDQLKFTTNNSKCCIDEFDYKKIEDDFSHLLSINLTVSIVCLEQVNGSAVEPEHEKYLSQINFDLPPPKSGRKLLQTIHQLKIDLPVC
jgi:hypothetical protein